MTNTIALSFELTPPEDSPTLSDIDRLARRLNITRDEFISRAMIVYAEEVEAQLQDPNVMRQFGSSGASRPSGQRARRSTSGSKRPVARKRSPRR